MRNRACQFDMPHTFAPDSRTRNENPATIAGNAFKFNPFIFTAVALPIAYGAKNLLAEKAVFFRFKSAVIERLGLLDGAMRPRANHLRRGNLYRNPVIFSRVHYMIPTFLSLFDSLGSLDALTSLTSPFFTASVLISKHNPCNSLIKTLNDSVVP